MSFKEGDRVIDTEGDIGTIVGIKDTEYDHAYWIKYDNFHQTLWHYEHKLRKLSKLEKALK